MMLSRPVLLGFIWLLLFHLLRGQPQISSQENKVYAYSYHFQHNGTTNSKDILRTVLGTDGDFDFDGKSIIKTFSSPNIRGFFTKGVLPAGPVSHSFNTGLRSSFNSNSAISNIRNVIQSNLQPPASTRNLLPPISPDIRNEFPGDFNNINDIGHNIYKTEEFPKISTLPVLQNQDDFPTIPSKPTIPSFGQNDFPKIPSPPSISPLIGNDLPTVPHHDDGVNRVENFERNTPNGGKVFGQVERFSYNPPPVINTNSNYQENAQGFRRNENFVNDNQEVTGHRTQSFFRQQFRTVTPNLESNTLNQNNRFNNYNTANNQNNNNNQWWNVLNVFGGNRNNLEDNNNNFNNNVNIFNRNGPGTSNENILRNDLNSQRLAHQIDQNIKEIKNNLNKNFRSAFGARLSNSNNRQNYIQSNSQIRQNNNKENRNQDNFNTQLPKQNNNNLPLITIPFNNRATTNSNYNHNEIRRNSAHQNSISNLVNQVQNNNIPQLSNHQQNYASQVNNELSNNQIANNQQNFNNQFKNDDTTRRVLNIINNVNSRLNNAEKVSNDVGVTWDDAIVPVNFNSDWSRRESFGTGRSFSNGHSSPLLNPIDDLSKTPINNLINDREINIPPIPDLGNNRNNYRNIDGGGMEKFFNFNKVVEGPNSFSQNQRRGFERNFRVNSNTGYQHANQWSTNTVRRLDAQGTRDDFSKDFIDVFRDDY